MLVVGLTGGIGTGKSTVAGMLRARGVPVVDADRVARDVVAPGTPGLERIVAAYGPDVLDDAGGLDRPRMRAKIAADPGARKVLEGITHPLIGAAIQGWIAERAAEGHPAVVVEAALMVETGSYRLYPVVVVVTCSPEVQLARVLGRDGPAAASLIGAQMPLAEKERHATHIIRNEGSTADLAAAVDRVWADITGSP